MSGTLRRRRVVPGLDGLGGSNNLRDCFSRLFGNARQWACKRASRRTLRNLTDVQLHDIGITQFELFIDESSASRATEQRELIAKVNKINPLVKLVGATSALMILAIAGWAVYLGLNSVQP